nr:sentrin-specific protease 7 [Quercus suber]
MPSRLVATQPRNTNESDEEEILYEQSGEETVPARKLTTRARMETDDTSALPATSTSHSRVRAGDEDRVSPYFSAQPRRLTRQNRLAKEAIKNSSPERWTQVHKPKRWTQSVVYPPHGGQNVATVDFRDLKTLDETEFINDSIIAFAMRQIQEKMKPEQREQVYFFNSFFYATLTSRNGQQSSCNFDAVKRWTRRADILSKPFIVVPINLDLHWFVAIICNVDQLPRKAASVEESVSGTGADQPSSAPHNTTPKPHQPDAPAQETYDHEVPRASHSTGMEIEGSTSPEHARISQLSKARKLKKRMAPPLRKHATTQPIVITLDSLGNTHPAELRNLKDYIVAEALDKRDISVKRDAILGMNVKDLPEQTNFCDCGLFLVHYIEEFAKDPRKFVDGILSRQTMDQESDFAKFNPSNKRAEIRDELLKLNSEQEIMREQKKKQKIEKKLTDSPEKSALTGEAAPLSISGELMLDTDTLEESAEDAEKQNTEDLPLSLKVPEELRIAELETVPTTNDDAAQAGDTELFQELVVEPAQALQFPSPRRKLGSSSPFDVHKSTGHPAAHDDETDSIEEPLDLSAHADISNQHSIFKKFSRLGH